MRKLYLLALLVGCTHSTPAPRLSAVTTWGARSTGQVVISPGVQTAGSSAGHVAITLRHPSGYQFAAMVVSGDTLSISCAPSWVSLNPDVAMVDETGLVRPVRLGSATIQAHCSGLVGATTVSVGP